VTDPAEQQLLADATVLLNRLADCRLPIEATTPDPTAEPAATTETAELPSLR
jgi:hypothetical protein